MGFLSSLFKLIIPIAGFALFGPIGFFAGSLVGSLLFPNKQPGQAAPQNIKVQTSTYGTTIPIVWGRYRLAGNIIWSTDIRPVVYAGYKGGSLFEEVRGPDTTIYKASWAIVFCEGPIAAITRIWFNGMEVYDVRETTPEKYIAKSIAKIGRDYDGITIYLGTETQTADPLILADENVPDTDLCAYRGLVYVVFTNWDLTMYGSRIPNVTAEIVTESTEVFEKWIDRSVETLPAVTQHAACVVNQWRENRIYVAGGFKWKGGSYEGSSDILKATMNLDGTLTWSTVGYLPQGNIGEFEIVYVPAKTLWKELYQDLILAFGGEDFSAGKTYYDPRDPSSFVTKMQCMLELEKDGNFTPMPCRGTMGGFTNGRVPLPRDSFAACYHDGVYPYYSVIWLYGGRNTIAKADPGGSDYARDSMFRDLWVFTGQHWELHTEIYEDHDHLGNTWLESEDGGAGYRIKHSMYSFRGTLFLAGGFGPAPGLLQETPLRDVYKLVISAPSRFVPVCTDVMSLFPGDKKLDYYISGLSEYRGTLLALISKNNPYISENYFVMQSTDMGVTWHILQRASFAIASKGVGTGGYGYYLVSGDQSEIVAAGDRMTIIGTTDFEESLVTAVEVTGGNTRLYTEWVSEPAIAAGTVYIHAIGGTITSETEYTGKSVQFLSFNEILFVIGGYKEYIYNNPPIDTKYGLQINEAQVSRSYADTVKLSDILYDLCIRAGLTDGEINVEDLQDVEIYGFAAYQTIRESIEQLRQFGFFDVVETEGQVKFVLRGGSAAAALTTDDLAAHPSGQETPGMIEYSIMQDMELPQELDVVYPDVDLDYNENTQIAHRLTTGSNKIETLYTPIVMDADKAAQMAHVLLYDAWYSRTAINIAVSRKYLYLDPGDVITITPVAGGTTYTCRIDQISYETNGIIKIQALIENNDLYKLLITGSHGQGGSSNPILLMDPEIASFFLDIPILSDKDDDWGFYFAAGPASQIEKDAWRGANLYIYGKESYYVFAREALGAIYHGKCKSILGSVPSATWWDNKNSLEVSMGFGSLKTATDDQIKEGKNIAVIGDAVNGGEIIQFQNVTDLGNGSYRLSKIQRGMYGTDWKISQHASDELFVLLEYNKLVRVSNITDSYYANTWIDKYDRNTPFNYVVAPMGIHPSEYTSTQFACTAVGKKPYSPVHLEAHKLENGDWKIEWMRRSRGSVSLFGGMRVPINESQAHGVYEIDFLDPDTEELLHTEEVDIMSIDPDAKPYYIFPVSGFYYYSGNKKYFRYGQKQIYGSEVNKIKVAIYQIGEAFGRGYPAEATFTV